MYNGGLALVIVVVFSVSFGLACWQWDGGCDGGDGNQLTNPNRLEDRASLYDGLDFFFF